MATGRTVSACFLTNIDRQVISLCDHIAKFAASKIANRTPREEFLYDFGKTNYSRDGGAGVGAGKLQRDALCTRGRQGKAPFSNRNLRWHPLVVAAENIAHAHEIDEIKIEGRDESQTLVFLIEGQSYPSSKVHELTERYVALPKHWLPLQEQLKLWSDTMWTQNSCIIPALEACDWPDAVETYAILSIAVGAAIYNLRFTELYEGILDILSNQSIDEAITLPSTKFPNSESEFISCPMCKVPINNNPADLPDRTRSPVWQPAWRATKRAEGEDSSMQIMHVNPLIEQTMNHNAKNVRYGHRWCNVAMTDHSLDDTLDFMEYIVKAHGRFE